MSLPTLEQVEASARALRVLEQMRRNTVPKDDITITQIGPDQWLIESETDRGEAWIEEFGHRVCTVAQIIKAHKEARAAGVEIK